MFETKKVWWIECRTGCTCCAYENFDQGFYFNEEEPKAIIERWRNGEGNPLSSQYAKYGLYILHESKAEILPDGRMIVDGIVFEPEEVDGVGHIYW